MPKVPSLSLVDLQNGLTTCQEQELKKAAGNHEDFIISRKHVWRHHRVRPVFSNI